MLCRIPNERPTVEEIMATIKEVTLHPMEKSVFLSPGKPLPKFLGSYDLINRCGMGSYGDAVLTKSKWDK